MPISCHNIHNVSCLPSLAWCRNLIPGQHNDGSPSRVGLLGGSQCLQPNRRILAQNTRKLPHPAWGPNPRRTGRRQQEWVSKQWPPSETGSSLQDAWEILREKNRGMATERTWNVPESLGTARNGFRRVPERPQNEAGSLLSPNPSPTHPHTKRGLGVESPPPPSVGWCHSTKGRREGRGGLDLGPQITRCMLSDRHDEASP